MLQDDLNSYSSSSTSFLRHSDHLLAVGAPLGSAGQRSEPICRALLLAWLDLLGAVLHVARNYFELLPALPPLQTLDPPLQLVTPLARLSKWQVRR